jgi:hypothetical protein
VGTVCHHYSATNVLSVDDICCLYGIEQNNRPTLDLGSIMQEIIKERLCILWNVMNDVEGVFINEVLAEWD